MKPFGELNRRMSLVLEMGFVRNSPYQRGSRRSFVGGFAGPAAGAPRSEGHGRMLLGGIRVEIRSGKGGGHCGCRDATSGARRRPGAHTVTAFRSREELIGRRVPSPSLTRPVDESRLFSSASSAVSAGPRDRVARQQSPHSSGEPAKGDISICLDTPRQRCALRCALRCCAPMIMSPYGPDRNVP